MASDLQARLESHSRAFEGLMSLLPADKYFGKDNSDQWQKKKQTKAEKKAAKKAKLMPDAYKTALDVHNEVERKRKRELQGEETSEPEDAAQEKPVQPKSSSKRQKFNENDVDEKNRAFEAREAKRKAKLEIKQQKQARKKADQLKQKENVEEIEADPELDSVDNQDASEQSDSNMDDDIVEKTDLDADEAKQDDLDEMESSNASTPLHDSPIFSGHSSASSTSSLQPPSIEDKIDSTSTISARSLPSNISTSTQTKAPDKLSASAPPLDSQSDSSRARSPKLPKIDTSILKARLAARIEALRAARQADGPNGKPARNRQELIEARRRREDARKQHKKELRAAARATTDNAVEDEAARLRGGSGSPLWSNGSPGHSSPRDNDFSFGRVAFADGAETDAHLSTILDPRRKKGPQDTRTALDVAARKQARIAGFDDEKRADIQEKERWLNAKKRVHGEKVRDDTNLLKKTLKRKQKGKVRSEKEWKGREEDLRKEIEGRQKKREDNLAKRREEKGVKRGKGTKVVKKKRPGFEGTFKAGGGKRK